jgi:hypothetical protein
MNDDPLPFQHKQPKKLNYKERVQAGIQRGGLKKMSEKKKDWIKKYNDKANEDKELQVCKICNLESHKDGMERHHPWGRSNENIMRYWWIHHECHAIIHANPNKAREQGWLFF